MENENLRIPNTPQELFAMQQNTSNVDEDQSFADYLVKTVLPEQDPSPYQTVLAVEMLLSRLRNYHFDVLHDGDSDLTAWQQKIWKDDLKHLEKALNHVRLINPD